jgi:hypothetical protein
MSAIFRKLNLKDQAEILVLNPPESFEPELAALNDMTIRRNLGDVEQITFSLAFVTTQQEVDSVAQMIAKKAQGDAVVWFAYPKGTSKRYRCEFNRDTGWDVLGQLGFEGVRQVAIDEDWSAVRFRRVEFIKTMIRDQQRAMTEQGKARAAKK